MSWTRGHHVYHRGHDLYTDLWPKVVVQPDCSHQTQPAAKPHLYKEACLPQDWVRDEEYFRPRHCQGSQHCWNH